MKHTNTPPAPRKTATSHRNEKYDLLIGIDPGTNTGMAIWSVKLKDFQHIGTLKIHKVMDTIKDICKQGERNDFGWNIKVYLEDSRNVSRGKNSAAMAQGAGSIKRDCNIWEDFLRDSGIDYQFIRPNKRSMLKMDDTGFRKMTGWNQRTNSHGRDAAMLVFGRNN